MPTSTATYTKATLIDVTRCIGCRACQVACENWNDCEGEETQLLGDLGLQNPAALSADTWTLITSHEIPDENAPGGLHYLFTMQRCLHCLEPACVSAWLSIKIPTRRGGISRRNRFRKTIPSGASPSR